ncbi:glutathione S-transferase [Spatholobus suberectus]|nr:glutathione S-transferase [Spatholobus suberectus]
MLIVEYIDEIWPHNSLLPADPYERALARFWVKYADDMFSAVAALYWSNNNEEREKNIEKIWEHFRVVENQCFGEQKKFFGGDTIDMVDICFGSIVDFLVVAEDILEVKVLEDEKFPHLHSWYSNFKDVPVIKENLPDQEKMFLFLSFSEKNVWHLPKKIATYMRSSIKHL